MNKSTSIAVTIALVVSIGIILLAASASNNNTAVGETVQNSEIKDGIQYITINAKGGYLPKVSEAVAGIPTKLIVKTRGTYDCSASLVVPSIGFKKILSQTGEEIIDIGIPEAGQPLRGVCGMGMYNFQIQFN